MDPETQRALLEYLLSMGYIGPQSFQTGGGIVPMGGDNGPSGDEKRAIDFAQDFNAYLADPVVGAQAGSQAFGMEGFQPIIQREEVDLPGRRMIQAGLAGSPGTMSNIIATEIANGGDQASAFAIISNILSGTPTTPEEEQIQQTLIGSIPPMMVRDDMSGTLVGQGPDLDKVWEAAGKMYDSYVADPVADEYTPDGLRGFNVTETPGPLTEKFNELGLPSPFERYDVNDMMGPRPEWDAKRGIVADMQQNIYSAMNARRDQERAAASQEQQRAMADELVSRVMRDGVGSLFGGEQQQAATQGGAPGGAWRIFGDEAPRVQGWVGEADDPFKSAGKSLANTFLGDESPFKNDSPVAAPSTPEPNLRALGTPLSGGTKTSTKRKADRRAAVDRARPAGPSPTMEAYRNYVNASQKVYTPDYMNTWIAVKKAQEQGRTPLSDVLSARRAQGVIGGLPVGWG